MNLQEQIRRILREETNPFKVSDPSTRIEEDRVQISLGRNKENHFGKVQNIIISVDYRMGILLIISFSECVAKVPSELV